MSRPGCLYWGCLTSSANEAGRMDLVLGICRDGGTTAGNMESKARGGGQSAAAAGKEKEAGDRLEDLGTMFCNLCRNNLNEAPRSHFRHDGLYGYDCKGCRGVCKSGMGPL